MEDQKPTRKRSRTKIKRIEIRLSQAEKDQLNQIIFNSDVHSIAELFRIKVLGQFHFSFDNSTPHKVQIRTKKFLHQDPKLTKNIAHIGNNINQLTRHVNTISRSGERFAAIELYEILDNINSKLESLIKIGIDD